MAMHNIAKKWTMPIRNWTPALNCFAIGFKECFLNRQKHIHKILYRLGTVKREWEHISMAPCSIRAGLDPLSGYSAPRHAVAGYG
ncbi:hypothetical protein KSB_45250 [Ktedonobacter robiniae]|uniref:Uncharacterized protein n=1 Tax=Ktedonobacter robiniae TaxID=2778365 RepID=A0ABQ3UUM8_9CHLR|nr:hypothetical protein KSB_45250 [Ktedonobacter robiniae]